MNFIEDAKKKIESIFENKLSKGEMMEAVQKLFGEKLVASFKNGIEVGKKRSGSQSKGAKNKK